MHERIKETISSRFYFHVDTKWLKLLPGPGSHLNFHVFVAVFTKFLLLMIGNAVDILHKLMNASNLISSAKTKKSLDYMLGARRLPCWACGAFSLLGQI
jgi:hypothetical protein